jgi:hypothetical protein
VSQPSPRSRAARGALFAACVAVGVPLAAPARGQSLHLWVDFAARGGAVESPPSWLDGGPGRLGLGEAGSERTTAGLAEAALGLDWQSDGGFAAHLHARGRADGTAGGEPVGLVEAWLEGTTETRGGADRLRLRGGQLFLPTSRENVRPLWSSPYTFTLSALNSWIGEEVRPLGLLVEYEATPEAARGWRAGGSALLGNDTAGTLLAWRGWAMGDRLSGLGETLPLPELPSFAPGQPFAGQDSSGTRPVGADLDGRAGWAGWLRWRAEGASLPLAGLLQLTHFDNRGDRDLHDGEYAWDTRFDLLAAELRVGDGWTLAGEHLTGRTAMGLPTARADVALRASYALLSWERTPLRATVRWDRFSTRDRDRFAAAERNDEDGRAWTAALLWQLRERLFVGLEMVDLAAQRAPADGSGVRDEGGRTLTLGVRWRIGRS